MDGQTDGQTVHWNSVDLVQALLFSIFSMSKAMKARCAARRQWGRPRPLTVRMQISFLTMLTHKQVDGVIDALFDVACAELKKNGHFNFINMVRLKFKPAQVAKEGFHPITKAPITIKAKNPIIKGFTMRKFKLALASELECRWIR